MTDPTSTTPAADDQSTDKATPVLPSGLDVKQATELAHNWVDNLRDRFKDIFGTVTEDIEKLFGHVKDQAAKDASAIAEQAKQDIEEGKQDVADAASGASTDANHQPADVPDQTASTTTPAEAAPAAAGQDAPATDQPGN